MYCDAKCKKFCEWTSDSCHEPRYIASWTNSVRYSLSSCLLTARKSLKVNLPTNVSFRTIHEQRCRHSVKLHEEELYSWWTTFDLTLPSFRDNGKLTTKCKRDKESVIDSSKNVVSKRSNLARVLLPFRQLGSSSRALPSFDSRFTRDGYATASRTGRCINA